MSMKDLIDAVNWKKKPTIVDDALMLEESIVLKNEIISVILLLYRTGEYGTAIGLDPVSAKKLGEQLIQEADLLLTKAN
jgi:hypothetical protein